MRHPRLRLWFAFVLAIISRTASLAVSPATPPIPTSAGENALQQGTLPNGFRYAILPRMNEPGRISLRLIVHAGSLDEHDDERGFAHFVEHMAFNGTRHYPPGKLVLFFQRLGLGWGADVNAETSFTSTIFRLDLPAGQAAHFGEALQVLGDYADGIRFDPGEVRRERGVILSEISARDTDEWQINTKLLSLYYAGTSLPERMPMGAPELIRGAEATGLRHFYERCYRPERMTLLVVGDVASGSVQGLLEKNFGQLHVNGPGAAQVMPAPLAARNLSAYVVATPLSNAAAARLLAIAPAGPNTTATIEEAFANGIAVGVLGHRLSERQVAQSRRIGRAEAAFAEGLDNRYILSALDADAATGDWAAALGLLENELRRARENGFTTGEVREVVTATLASMRAGHADFAGRSADQIANGIASVLAADRAWCDPATLLAVAEHYSATFTAEMATNRLRRILSDDQLQILLMTPKPPAEGAGAVLAAYRASAALPLAQDPVKVARDLTFPYDDFGPAGAIAEQRQETSLGLDLVRFANGARLNLRASAIEPGRFRLWARLGRGTADVPREMPGINLVATALMGKSDLGRLTRDELGRLTAAHAVDGNWTFDDNEFMIQLTGPSAELSFALHSLTACLADVKLEATKLPDALSLYPRLTGSYVTSTQGRTKVEGMFRATGEDPRYRLPGPAEVEHYSFEVVSAWLRTHWLEGPLEVGVAGDFKPDDAIAAAAASIGTLTTRREPTPVAGERFEFRAKAYRNLSYVDLPDKTAYVRVFWPMRGAGEIRTYRALRVATAALEDRLRITLRQELGATYAPGGSVYRAAQQLDFGFIYVDLTFDPTKAQKFAERTIKLAGEFARKGLSKEEFARLREPLRAAALADLRSNEWWLSNVLMRAQSDPAVLGEARTHGTAFDDLTRDEVNRITAAHFNPAESNAVGFIPQAPPLPKKP